MKLLIVEDEPEMGRQLERGLTAEGYDTVLFDNGVDALIAAADTDFAAAAIDVMLPGMSGFELCRRLREAGDTVPILLLTARDAVEDRVFGLDSGADDYLTKPFAFVELSARIRALVRRDHVTTRPTVSLGRLTIDSLAHRATVSDRELSLSPKEFALLRLLADHADTVLSRPEILREVWGSERHIDPNIIDQYISYLRKKLDAAGAEARIRTRRGEGFLISAPEASRPAAR